MMKKMMLWMMTALLMLSFAGCAGKPAETTAPPETTLPGETEPILAETTVPPITLPPETTEPETPQNYVNLTQMIKGTDITMTVDGPDITLTEDGLTVTMSTLNAELYRRDRIAGVMEANPIMEAGQVYIHETSFMYFFRGDSGDPVSLFHGIRFFADEVIAALEQPESSDFNIKLVAQVCLPTSMGIEIPNIDPTRIFSETPMSELSGELTGELRMYGYTGDYLYGEYQAIQDSRNMQRSGLSADGSLTAREYQRKHAEQAILDRMTDEQEAFFAEKQIQLTDYYDLNSWYHGGFMDHTDQELIEALETCYRSKLALSLSWEYPGQAEQS